MWSRISRSSVSSIATACARVRTARESARNVIHSPFEVFTVMITYREARTGMVTGINNPQFTPCGAPTPLRPPKRRCGR
eukprot:6599920-Prymnesium_polylepis.1